MSLEYITPRSLAFSILVLKLVLPTDQLHTMQRRIRSALQIILRIMLDSS
jgi:hypothetical protein